MANNPNTPLYDYPQPFGGKIAIVFDHSGPLSYSNIGSSSGTGDVINATDLGEGGFDEIHSVFGGYSNSGNYAVKAYTGSASGAVTLTLGGLATKAITLVWYAVSPAFGTIGSEVANATNLTAEQVRLDALMV